MAFNKLLSSVEYIYCISPADIYLKWLRWLFINFLLEVLSGDLDCFVFVVRDIPFERCPAGRFKRFYLVVPMAVPSVSCE